MEEAKLFGVTDYLVFCGMLAACVLTGLYHGLRGSKQRSAAQQLTGKGQLSTVPVSLSLLASFLSSITLMGQPAEVYLYGPQMWLFGLACLPVIPVVSYLIPFFREKNYFSAYQYFGDRFSRKLQFSADLLFTFQMVFYLALVFYAPALAVNQVTGLDTMMVVSVMYVVCIFYTTIGGMKAVVWTDTLQVVVLFGAMLSVLVKAVVQLGGPAVVWRRNADNHRTSFFSWSLDMTERYTVWSTFLGSSLLFISSYGGNQLQIQRYLTVSSVAEAKKMLWINLVGWTVVVFLTTGIGMVIYATYDGCDPISTQKIAKPDQIFPFFIMDMLSDYPGFPGIFMCGIFSAGLSTVSTGMNSLAAIWYAELEGSPLRGDDAKSARLVRLLAFGFGVLSYLVVFIVPHLAGLVELGISLNSVCTGSLFSLFILGIFFPSTNSYGAGAGLLTGVLAMTWISLGSILSASSGLAVRQPPLPLSTALCQGNASLSSLPSDDRPLAPPIYRISFLWYSAVTILVTICVALIVSWLTNMLAPNSLQKKLSNKPILEPSTNISLMKTHDNLS